MKKCMLDMLADDKVPSWLMIMLSLFVPLVMSLSVGSWLGLL